MRTAICIPVRGDAAGIAETVRTIRTEADGDGVFVVVSVAGPQPAVEAAARDAGADEVVVLPHPEGSYAARNAAIDVLPADVDVVVFTDAGCRPRPGWIAAHRAALERDALSGGAVVRVRRAKPSPAEYVDAVRNLNQERYVERDGFAATCNLAVRRSVLDAVRFDGALQSGGDREFCRRAQAAGFTLGYTADAAVEHDCRRTVGEVLAKARRVGAGVASLPATARPARLPVPRLQRGLAGRAAKERVTRNPLWLLAVVVVDALRTVAFVRAARAAGFRPGPPSDGRPFDVVVLLGTRWSELADHNTRWKMVIEELRQDDRVGTITLVDFPRFRRRRLVERSATLATRAASGVPGVGLIDATVAAGDRASALDRVGWWRTCRAIRRLIPSRNERLVLCATPLLAPALGRLGDTWSLFDAVDDWRAYQGQSHRAARIDLGYRWVAAHEAIRSTAVSSRLADTLRRDYGIDAHAVPNGVDLARFRDPSVPPPGPLPDRPFAVYVGVIEARVDLDLVAAVGRTHGDGSVVLAGPIEERSRLRLEEAGVRCLGRIAPETVPGLLHQATVALLPHHRGPQTDSMDPLKLLEYLAAGLEVVTTDVALPPDVPLDHVVVAATREEFVAAVGTALELPPARHDGGSVRHRSWHRAAEDLVTVATSGSPPPPTTAPHHPQRLSA